MKTRTTRRRPVTVQLGEQSLEIQAPGFKAIRRGAEKQFYWIKDDHAEFALYEPKTVRIYVDGLDPQAACERRLGPRCDDGLAPASDFEGGV